MDTPLQLVPARGYGVSLEAFEGPLDLLLHVVRRHELDILDIPIAFVAEKYFEYLDCARELDVELAGDYLVMAATLAYLKSRELLPKADSPDEEGSEGEEGPDPREELIARLVEYERFKNAANSMENMPHLGRDVFLRRVDPTSVEVGEADLAPIPLWKLSEAFARILARAKIEKSHEVEIEAVTVRQRMLQLQLILSDADHFDFEALFDQRVWRSREELRAMVVVTLMTVLEMVKLGVIGVAQDEPLAPIRVDRVLEVDKMKAVIAEFARQPSDFDGESSDSGAENLSATA